MAALYAEAIRTKDSRDINDDSDASPASGLSYDVITYTAPHLGYICMSLCNGVSKFANEVEKLALKCSSEIHFDF